jgi:small subunit ribosomal protein S2
MEASALSFPSLGTLLESGVHFGHQTSRWNPKMKPYIFGRKNVIHIIDLRATLRGLIRGANLLRNIAARGEFVLFVGTKRQAYSVVEKVAGRTGMPYVSGRWLGGTLTNILTIRSRLKRLTEIEEMETTGHMAFLSKKEVSRLRRELLKLRRNLTGIRDMTKLPGAVVVVDPGREDIAVKEARKLEIPVVGLVDTDTDPEMVDIVIPCNDDAFRAVSILLTRLGDAVAEGRKTWDERRVIEEKVQVRPAQTAEAADRKHPGRRPARRRRTPPSKARGAQKPAPGKTAAGPAPAQEKKEQPKAQKEAGPEPGKASPVAAEKQTEPQETEK